MHPCLCGFFSDKYIIWHDVKGLNKVMRISAYFCYYNFYSILRNITKIKLCTKRNCQYCAICQIQYIRKFGVENCGGVVTQEKFANLPQWEALFMTGKANLKFVYAFIYDWSGHGRRAGPGCYGPGHGQLCQSSRWSCKLAQIECIPETTQPRHLNLTWRPGSCTTQWGSLSLANSPTLSLFIRS